MDTILNCTYSKPLLCCFYDNKFPSVESYIKVVNNLNYFIEIFEEKVKNVVINDKNFYIELQGYCLWVRDY